MMKKFIFTFLLVLSLFMVQESINHFPIPLRKSLKVMALAKGSQTIVPQLIAEGDFLERLTEDEKTFKDSDEHCRKTQTWLFAPYVP